MYNTLERNEQALEYLQQGIAIARELKRPTSQTHALASMGEVYSRMAHHEKALEVHAQALGIAREAKYRPARGSHCFASGIPTASSDNSRRRTNTCSPR